MRGEVVRREMWDDFNASLPIRRMFGYDLVVDVEAALRLVSGGPPSWDPKLLGSGKQVRTIRRLHRPAVEGQEVLGRHP